LDKRKVSIEKASKVKWEKPELVILSRNTEMTADGVLAYTRLLFSEVQANARVCIIDGDT